ncbi:MAG TPA: sugar transferase [Candidatus Krumholzibacteria bacterium]|nr:sugar transferase [Candidatus Krumholzibacteria bacterium]
MKKNLAAFRYSDQKVIPLYAADAVRGASQLIPMGDRVRGGGIVKRAFDILFALVVGVLGLPFYLLIAVFIKLTSEGPVLFVQDRVGQDGRTFKFYKFRTMLVDNNDHQHRSFAEDFIKGRLMNAEEGDRRVFKLQNDPRVTSIGRFLRKTSLDELPQFINVLRGEMTLVGPRPPLAYELAHYKEWHRGRLAVKPGLTGLWQVSGRSTVPFDEMVMLDLYYIENWSMALDMKIILRTVPVMLFGLGGY